MLLLWQDGSLPAWGLPEADKGLSLTQGLLLRLQIVGLLMVLLSGQGKQPCFALKSNTYFSCLQAEFCLDQSSASFWASGLLSVNEALGELLYRGILYLPHSTFYT